MSLASFVNWASLLPEILQYKLRPFLISIKSIKSARLVCRAWNQSLLLPSILIRFPSFLDTNPLQLLKSTKAIKFDLQRPTNENITTAFSVQLLENITKVNNITRLDLSGNVIDATIINLLALTTQIQSLSLAGAKLRTDTHIDLFDVLNRNRMMKTLDLSNTHTWQQHPVAGLVGCISLTNLNVSINFRSDIDVAKPLAEIISQSQSLRVLNMSSNTLKNKATVDALIHSITSSSSITSLDISKCVLGVQGGEIEFLKALRHSRGVTKLNLSGLCPDEARLKILAHSLTENPTFKSLTLAPSATSPEARTTDILTPWFINNPTNITSLTLALSRLTQGELVALFNFLKTTKSLTTLNLAQIRLNATLSELSDGLASNSTLKYLDLTHTMLGENARPDQMEAFSSAVARHPTLTKLNLNNCNLSSTLFTELCQRLATSTTLQTLNLSKNRLGTSQAQALEPLFTQNFSLTHLDISGNQFGTPGGEILARFLATNSTLLRLAARSIHLLGKDQLNLIDSAIRSQLLELDIRGNAYPFLWSEIREFEQLRVTISQRPSLGVLFPKKV